MIKFVVLNNYKQVNSYLNNLQSIELGSCKFISNSKIPNNINILLRNYGIKKALAKEHSFERQKEILTSFLEISDQINYNNGSNEFWWYSGLSTKSPYHNLIYKYLNEFIQIINCVEITSGEKLNMLLILPSKPVLSLLFEVAKNNKWEYESNGINRYENIINYISKYIKLIRMFISTILYISKSEIIKRLLLNNTTIPSSDQEVYLIKSYAYNSSFDEDGKYIDPFFDKLSEHISKNTSNNVITIAKSFSDISYCYNNLIKVNRNVVPFEYYHNSVDVFRSFLVLIYKLIYFNINLTINTKFLGYDINPLLASMNSFEFMNISVDQYFLKSVAKQICRKHKIFKCVMTFEGTPWERCFISSIRTHSPGTRILAYIHNCVPLSESNFFLTPSEIKYMPKPDSVMTSGNGSTSILKKFGYYPNNYIKSTCSFRYNYFFNSKHKTHKLLGKESLNILVILDGISECEVLYNYIINQAKKNNRHNFILRPHPALPENSLKKLFFNAEQFSNNIYFTENKNSVIFDISSSDIVLYRISAVSFESIVLGRPVIYFDDNHFLPNDPLFELESFKWTINVNDEIIEVINMINELSDKTLEDLHNTAIKYVTNYYNPVNNHYLKEFL